MSLPFQLLPSSSCSEQFVCTVLEILAALHEDNDHLQIMLQGLCGLLAGVWEESFSLSYHWLFQVLFFVLFSLDCQGSATTRGWLLCNGLVVLMQQRILFLNNWFMCLAHMLGFILIARTGN